MANPEMQERFLKGEDKPHKSEARTPRKPIRRKPLQEVPPERRGFWHGVMCANLRSQERDPAFVGFYCCQCGDPDCNSQIEGFDEARRFFVPGHIKPRSSFSHKGFRLRYVQTLGPDDPDNIVPVSPSCNASEFWNRQGRPEWSGKESA